MTNTAPYNLAAAYAALEAAPPIAVGSTNVKYPMPIRDDSGLSRPHDAVRYFGKTLASHAGLKALTGAHVVAATGNWKLEGPAVDAVPAYMHFGTAAAAAGDDDFTITENATGVPIQLVIHEEMNNLGKVRDWHPAFATEFKLSVKDGYLWNELTGIAGGSTAGNKLTTAPSALFGNNSPLAGYPAHSPLNSITWNAQTLTSWFQSLELTSKCTYDAHTFLHTAAVSLYPRRERVIDAFGMTIVVDNDAAIQAVFDDVDATTSSDLVMKFARTATDYQQWTVENVLVEYFDVEPVNWKSRSGITGSAQMATIVFTPPTLAAGSTRVSVLERQATANANATYQVT